MKFLTKRHIARRTFLRGAGAVIALPFLESMVPAQTPLHRTAAAPPQRLGCIFVPHGSVMSRWTPQVGDQGLKLGPILRPLAPHRDCLTLVSNLVHSTAEGLDATAEHNRSAAVYLTGAPPSAAELRCGVSVDQILAQKFAKETVLPSLELAIEEVTVSCSRAFGCAYQNAISWRNPTTPMPTERNPQKVFEKLFGGGASPEERLARSRENRSILDSIVGTTRALKRDLPPQDRVRLDSYLDDVREVERRTVLAERFTRTAKDLPVAPEGNPELFGDHLKILFDLTVLAYRGDLTRVFTLMYAKDLSGATYPDSGCRTGFHSASHHSNESSAVDDFALINTYHVKLFSQFVEHLAATPDGDGSLLGHSLLLYGSSMSNANEHNRSPLPIALLGGGGHGLRGNRHIVAPPQTPMTNLLLGVLDVFDVHEQKLGDSAGRITL